MSDARVRYVASDLSGDAPRVRRIADTVGSVTLADGDGTTAVPTSNSTADGTTPDCLVTELGADGVGGIDLLRRLGDGDTGTATPEGGTATVPAGESPPVVVAADTTEIDESSFGPDGRPAARVAFDAGATEYVRLDGTPGGRAALAAAVERVVARNGRSEGDGTDAAETDSGTDDGPDETTLLERLRRLHEATRRLMRVDSAEEVARTATTAAADVLDFELSGVRLYDSETDVLVPVQMSSQTTEQVGERPAYEPGSSIHWDVLDSGECAYFDDVTDIPDDVTRSGSGSVMYLPLGASGVFSVGRASGGEISEQNRRLAEVLAANTTAAIERAQREAALREREAALAERNDRLETFADAAAHDLRNPLNIVAANVEMARDGEVPAGHDPLTDAAQGVDRMERIIDRYLTLARNGQVVDTLESVTVGEVARDAWATVETDTATLDVVDEVPIDADPERLRTLLENLFRNAIEHGGVDVTVEISRLPDGTGFRVTDDGSGFGDTDPESLFEVGATDDSEGTGLGLASVRRISEAHGWTVVARDARDGDGASFAFETGAKVTSIADD